ncbi:nucleotidyltransferase family protein [Streptomyces cinnabarinus]|uniref:Nucleotidyltransferase family protein n=1 Tax=Streptomyces cinnabarinus TaxID=67287 RepID=A0ABY7K5F5_9ACTN|nr:nucleotidyltransferase family protein [Streptomyces cinnabarinus]WAZ19584.1 nucleotidyltransferase family protein [Streptomyces cinnabarinus]
MPNAHAAFRLLRWCADRTRDPGLGPCDDGVRSFLRSRNIDSLLALSSGVTDARQIAYDTVWRHQLRALHQVVEALTSTGVRTLTFKGGELIPRHFPGHSLGFMGDGDILVGREQIETVKSVLYGLGFRHAVFDAARGTVRDRDLREVAETELHHYELASFVRTVEVSDPEVVEAARAHHAHPLYALADRAVILTAIDVHHNVALDADPTPLFDRAVPSGLGVGETLSPADHVWLNLSRYYNEVAIHGGCSLRPFAYTLPEIAAGQVAWDVVEQVAEELALGPTLSYFLRFCDQLAPGRIPADTLAVVHRSANSRVRDWGWQLAKLFDFQEAFPADAFAPAAAHVHPTKQATHPS